MRTTASPDKETLRILRHLAKKGVSLERRGDNAWRFAGSAQPLAGCSGETVAALVQRGVVAARADAQLALSDTGAALLRRLLAGGGEDFAAQHQERAAAVVTDGDGARGVTLNRAESPLAWLRSRRDRDGRPFIDAVAFTAGERLRADYSRGQIMPRVTANWMAAVADGRRGGAGGMAELTEAAIAARRRVERALEAVGPDLAGLLVDFCCFLKGLEEIERERRWPHSPATTDWLRLRTAPHARDRSASGERRTSGRLSDKRLAGGEGGRLRPHAIDQRAQAVCPLRRQMLAELETAEGSLGVGGGNLRRRLVVEEHDRDGDQAAHDDRIAVTDKTEHGLAVPHLGARPQPHLAGAAAHLVGVGAMGVRQRLQMPAELDDVAVALFPVAEEVEVGRDLVEGRHGGLI